MPASSETPKALTIGEMIEKVYLGMAVLTNQNNEIQKTLALLGKNQEGLEKKLEALQTEQKKMITLPGQLSIISGSVKQVDTKVDTTKKEMLALKNSTAEGLEGINRQLVELSLNVRELNDEQKKARSNSYSLWQDQINLPSDCLLDPSIFSNSQQSNRLLLKEE